VHWFYAPFFAALEPAFRTAARQDSNLTSEGRAGEPFRENPFRETRLGGALKSARAGGAVACFERPPRQSCRGVRELSRRH
jgi:hypothetical protein